MRRRCAWAKSEISIPYHDEEWGVPVHDDRKLFEMLILEGAQAGLSWETVLRKRTRYREVFDNFDAKRVARYDKHRVRNLLAAAIQNAKAFLDVQQEFGSFDVYLWRFVDGRPLKNARRGRRVPARTRESDVLSKDLQKRGFKFVGTTICYAMMQAVGMVNDHSVDCFRHGEIG